MLELRRVQILATLAVEGTMTATAARLHLTTSAVSQQVALLEKEVGLPLLVRSGRNVILNEAGHALVGHYAQIAEEAEAHLRTFHSDVRGSLAISTFPSFCSVVLPEALMELRRDHPGLSTYVRDLEPLESIAQLRGGGIDIAVVDDVHDLELDGIVTVELGRDEVLLCASPDHRPAQGPAGLTIALADYADVPWVLDVEGSAFATFVRSVCRDAGFEPRVVANCSNLVASLGLVRAGYGVALMSELNLGPATADLVVRRVDPPVQRAILVAMRASSVQAPSVRAVVQALRRATRARAGARRGAPHGSAHGSAPGSAPGAVEGIGSA